MLSLNNLNFNNFKALTAPSVVSKPSCANRLQIFYFNDVHGNLDEASGLVEAGKAFRNKSLTCDTFVLSGGDNVSGGDTKKNEVVFGVLNNFMQVDALAAGNHEFDGGLEAFLKIIKDKNLSVVATNVDFDDESGADELIQKSKIVTKGSTKYGFVGAMPIDFKSCTKKTAQEGVEVMDFDDTVEALQEEIDKLKAQNIDRIILLSHTGYHNDIELAKKLDGVDIIISGHSHTPVEGAKEGENVVKSKSGEPVVIVQAGENARYYGVLDVEFNKKGVLSKISNSLNPLCSKKNPNLEYIKDANMGVSPKAGTIKQIDPMPQNRRTTPHGWAYLVVDSMREEFGADCAFLNAANVRKVPTEGKLTQRDITESVPMKNKLIRTKVTQKQVVDAIKQASKETMQNPSGEPGLLFTSGFEYKINDKGDLLELYFVDKKGTKTKIDINNPKEDVTYDAVYDEFTMKHDGEYPHLAPKFDVKMFDYDKDVTAMNHISKRNDGENLTIIDDNRIQILPS